jgi:CO dehydrogenase/acetyl-CoA synthase alpha subunit
MKNLKPNVTLLETNPVTLSKKMSQYSCVDLSQVTEAEQKEAIEQLRASAKELARRKLHQAHQALIESARLMKISFDEERAKKNANREFTLCQRCVVASPEEQVSTPDTDAQ